MVALYFEALTPCTTPGNCLFGLQNSGDLIGTQAHRSVYEKTSLFILLKKACYMKNIEGMYLSYIQVDLRN